MTNESLFIVVEGMDGSGKTGITRQLRATLSQTHGDNVALTFEPHDPSVAGVFIRDALTKRIKASPLSLALAFALNRAEHNARVINPFLDHNKAPRIIISDRYTLSSLVYQSAGGLTMDDIYHINQWARQPDMTIFLNVSPHNCYARMRNRPQDKELFEKNLSDRAETYQQGIHLLRSKGETVLEVDANPSYPEVFAAVLETLQTHAPPWLRIQPPLILDDPQEATATLSQEAEPALFAWVDTLTADDVMSLSIAETNRLFRAYVIAQGFSWGERLTWSDTEVYSLNITLPMDIQQSGVALILDSQQQADRITKTLQTLLDKSTAKPNLLRMSDFMIVLDNGRFEPNLSFERGHSPERRLSPHIRIVTRQTLQQWIHEQ